MAGAFAVSACPRSGPRRRTVIISDIEYCGVFLIQSFVFYLASSVPKIPDLILLVFSTRCRLETISAFSFAQILITPGANVAVEHALPLFLTVALNFSA
jgi:hypothetical protein